MPTRQGLWQDSRFLLNFFEPVQQDKVVVKDFNFKKRNLKGMRCKVLHHNRSHGQSFVEFDEDVGGGSADGLGKTGFCVALPSELLENVDESPKDDPKEKKKSVEGAVEVDELPPDPAWTTIVNELPPIKKELWATITDSQTLDPEPIAIKAKIATRQLNVAKQGDFIKQRLADVEWEESAKKLWNEDSEGNEIRWTDPFDSNIFERDPFGE